MDTKHSVKASFKVDFDYTDYINTMIAEGNVETNEEIIELLKDDIQTDIGEVLNRASRYLTVEIEDVQESEAVFVRIPFGKYWVKQEQENVAVHDEFHDRLGSIVNENIESENFEDVLEMWLSVNNK